MANMKQSQSITQTPGQLPADESIEPTRTSTIEALPSEKNDVSNSRKANRRKKAGRRSRRISSKDSHELSGPSSTKARRRSSPNSSWAGLELDMSTGNDNENSSAAIEPPSTPRRHTMPRRPSSSSWGALDLDLSSHNSISSHNSKNSWAGLDIFSELSRPAEDYHPIDGAEDCDSEDDFVESLLQDMATTQDKRLSVSRTEQTYDSDAEGDDDDDDESGLGAPCWLDFDVDELSESDSETYSEDDDDEWSSENDGIPVQERTFENEVEC